MTWESRGCPINSVLYSGFFELPMLVPLILKVLCLYLQAATGANERDVSQWSRVISNITRLQHWVFNRRGPILWPLSLVQDGWQVITAVTCATAAPPDDDDCDYDDVIISCNSRIMDFLSLGFLYKLDRKCKERKCICSFVSSYFVSKMFIPQDLYV